MRPALGGTANLCCLLPEGQLLLYGGHDGNALYRFRLGELWIACTGLHSDDDSVFDLVFPDGVSGVSVAHELLRRNPAERILFVSMVKDAVRSVDTKARHIEVDLDFLDIASSGHQ